MPKMAIPTAVSIYFYTRLKYSISMNLSNKYKTNPDGSLQFQGKGVCLRALAARDIVHLEVIKEVEDLRGTKNTIYASPNVSDGKKDVRNAFSHSFMSISS